MKTASLVISTYNNTGFLKPVLLSAFLQETKKLREIIIIDDGSKPETLQLIEELSVKSPFKIIHVWHPDDGFRLAEIRNKGAREATGDILIFIDGDMCLEKNFVEDHISASQENLFLQGSRIRLGPKITKKITSSGSFKSPSFFSLDIKNRFYVIRSKALSKLHATKKGYERGIRGCNISLHKTLFEKVNGFDNRFVGWGREDNEFVARLLNFGADRRDIKNLALAYHLYHNELERVSLIENDKILNSTLNNKFTYALNGFKEANNYITRVFN
jgi:glycosyltransferase involved in cell wall biosynthesis